MLLAVAGASGSGKDSVISAVVSQVPLERVAAYTTRPKRPGEVSGEHYRFVDQAVFDMRISEIEFFDVVEVNGFSYGTPLDDLRTTAGSERWYAIPLAIDSALALRSKVEGVHVVYVLPPSRHAQLERLISRGFSREEALARVQADPDNPSRCLECDLIVVNYTDELRGAAERVVDYLNRVAVERGT